MTQIKISSLIKFYTILLLHEGPKHGYNLMKELGKKLGRKISSSQVYPFLSILEREKIIKVKEIGKRDKKKYKVTPKGKIFINNFLQRFGDLFYLAIKPKISTCTHCGCKIYEGSYKKRIGKRRLTFCCHHCANNYKIN